MQPVEADGGARLHTVTAGGWAGRGGRLEGSTQGWVSRLNVWSACYGDRQPPTEVCVCTGPDSSETPH